MFLCCGVAGRGGIYQSPFPSLSDIMHRNYNGLFFSVVYFMSNDKLRVISVNNFAFMPSDMGILFAFTIMAKTLRRLHFSI